MEIKWMCLAAATCMPRWYLKEIERQQKYHEYCLKMQAILGKSREEILKSFQSTPWSFETFYLVVMREGELPSEDRVRRTLGYEELLQKMIEEE